MCTEVYRHQHIETGGNLFGLWTTSGSAVIHVALGPGKNCRRTTTSFHQNIEYLHRVGRFVNDNYMLCHIGEWHSHHSLSLNKPSSGDEQTVRRNFPQGVTKFLVIIANIKNKDTIVLSPYFFTDEGRCYEKAEYVVLDSDGPYSINDKILEQIHFGAEGAEGESHNRDTSYNTRNLQNRGSNSSNTNSTCVQANPNSTSSKPDSNNFSKVDSPNGLEYGQHIPASQANQSQSASIGSEEPMDIENCVRLPPRDYDSTKATSETTTSAPPSGTSAGNQNELEMNLNGDDQTPSEREIVLKKIYDQLKNWFGTESESVFNFETSKDYPGAIEISFKHNKKFWMVHFPKCFPVDPAKLFCSQFQEMVRLSVSKVQKVDLVEPLENDINILLTIKNRCGDYKCDVCRHFTKESLFSSNFNSDLMERLVDSVKRLVHDVKISLGQVDNLKQYCLSDREAEVTFTHGGWRWMIRFPINFPDEPATAHYFMSELSSQKRDLTLHGKHSCGPQALNSPELIIKAIHTTCICASCYRARRQNR